MSFAELALGNASASCAKAELLGGTAVRNPPALASPEKTRKKV
jgi:hypothetical protein